MFCQSCGAQMNDNAKFCHVCGANVDCGASAGAGARSYSPAQPVYAPNLVGFSQRIHDPVFEKLRKAGFRKSLKHGLIFFPILLLLFQIIPFFSEDFTRQRALIIGCVVGGFGLVWTLVGGARRASAKTWDGEVIDKKITERTTHNENSTEYTRFYHTITFRLAGGRKKKMKQKHNTGALNAWDMMIYLNIGDRVRYHGKLDYFEKYDKSRDTQLPCANCRQYIDIRLDVCPKCRVPVVKP